MLLIISGSINGYEGYSNIAFFLSIGINWYDKFGYAFSYPNIWSHLCSMRESPASRYYF